MTSYTESDIRNCFETLLKGGLILYPTDTIWGIGCDATNVRSVSRIFELKKRDDQKTMIVLVSGKDELLRYVRQPDPGVFDFLEKTDRPTTVIYHDAIGLAPNLIRDGSIAIRICKDPFCNDMIKSFGKPVVSTSANLSGEPAPTMFDEISDEIKRGVDYLVKYRQDEQYSGSPSLLVDWEKGQPVVLRS